MRSKVPVVRPPVEKTVFRAVAASVTVVENVDVIPYRTLTQDQ